ncbi:uncharacterized protein LOC62_03G004043 [Vanrija pseudolonga]|uniref:Uncharacterized protein n=1 Tax=Vanrija pseudolonga TaxID=143232 RepID=A0AAF1BL84_9TREE|nr:hypothetical protein LOC62_03G004043 [Vanrija pseudolonga]
MSLVPPSPTASVPPPYADTKDANVVVPPSPTFTTASEEKRELAKTDADAEALLADGATPAEVCAALGHDTSLPKARMIALAAVVPGSMLYFAKRKTAKCNRCHERVERTSCCPWK